MVEFTMYKPHWFIASFRTSVIAAFNCTCCGVLKLFFCRDWDAIFWLQFSLVTSVCNLLIIHLTLRPQKLATCSLTSKSTLII